MIARVVEMGFMLRRGEPRGKETPLTLNTRVSFTEMLGQSTPINLSPEASRPFVDGVGVYQGQPRSII